MSSFQDRLQTFIDDHCGHGTTLDFESQEFIQCIECEETFVLPRGSGVNQLEDGLVVIEVPSGIANGYLKYLIDFSDGGKVTL